MLLLRFFLFVPLLFLFADAFSVRGGNNKREVGPSRGSEQDSPRKENKSRPTGCEPFFVKPRSTNSVQQKKERDNKRQQSTERRVPNIDYRESKHRERRDLLTSKSKPIPARKSDSWENSQADNGVDHPLKDLRNAANRMQVLKALSSSSKKGEKGHFKDEDRNGVQGGKHGSGSNRSHPKHRHSLSDQPFHVKMIYPATPKPDRRKYTYKDLVADRKRLEQKITYIKNMLSVNDSMEDPVRTRRSESDRTANKIAKMFLTLSAMNGLNDRRKSKCRNADEEDEEEDRVQDVWEKERRNSPTRKTSSSNEERYKTKKWIEFMKNKRSSGKTCPCMGDVGGDDGDVFPLEQKVPKDYFLMERGRSSEESSEIYGDSYYSRDKLMDQNRGQEKQIKPKGKKKLNLPLQDLELYRSRAKQILQNAEEILDKIKWEEEKRLSAPNIMMDHLKELTSRIQSDPRNNENDLIRKIQKNLGWTPLSKTKESPDSFLDNVNSYILDPYERAKALTDESAKMLSSYLLRNLGKMEDSTEKQEPDQTDRDNAQVYFGRVQTKEEEKPMVASLAIDADPLSKNKEELQNWEDTLSKIMTGAEEGVNTEPDLGKNRESFKNRMEDIIKEQQKKVTDYEILHQNSEESDDRTANQQQKEEVESGNTRNASERPEDKGDRNANQQEEVESGNAENLKEVAEEEKDLTADQQEVELANPESLREETEIKDDRIVDHQEEVESANPESLREVAEEEKDLTADQQEVELANPESLREETEIKDDRIVDHQEEVESANPESLREETESKHDRMVDQQEEVESGNPESLGEEAESKDDRIVDQQEEVESANPESLREEAESKDDRMVDQQEEVESANPENPSEGAEEDKDVTVDHKELESANPENPSGGSEGKDDRIADQQEEVESANPENSSQMSEDEDLETDGIENPLTADTHNTQKTVEKGKEPKKPDALSKNESSHFEKDNSQNIQDLSKETLEKIMKTIGENADSVETQRETKDPQQNSQTADAEEENEKEENRFAELPKIVSDSGDRDETQDRNLSLPHMADDYDVLDGTPETGENLEENSNETFLQRQEPVEMREESDFADKSTEDNPELLDPSRDDKEIVNLKSDQDKDYPNVEETQTGLEEITQGSENTKPNEDNLKLRQGEQKNQTDDESDTINQQENTEIVESESETVSDNEEGNQSTLQEEKNVRSRFRYLEDDDDIPWQLSNIVYEQNEKTAKSETQKAENTDDQPSSRTDEAKLEMAKDETHLKETINGDERKETDEVLESQNETAHQENLNEEEEELDEDKTALQEANPNRDENNDDAQNSYESVQKARDEGNLDEDDEKPVKSINPDINTENERTNEKEDTSEALNTQNGENPDESLLTGTDPKENPEEEDLSRDEKTSEETPLTSASGDQTSEDVQGTSTERENEESDESSDEKNNGEALKDPSEYPNKETQEDEDDESQEQAEDSGETVSRPTLENENNQDKSEGDLKKANSFENFDKTGENLHDVDDDDVEAVDPKESEKDKESPQINQSGASLRDTDENKPGEAAKTEHTENPEEEDSEEKTNEETPLRSALGDQTEDEPENPHGSANLRSREEINDPDSSEDGTEETRADVTDDSHNRLHLENKHETPLKTAHSGEPGENWEGNGYESSREDNLGENLILEENDETPVRKADSEERPAPFKRLQEPEFKTPKLKIPKSIGKLMKDLDEKGDVTSVQNLNPDRIDDIIDKIDEAEQQNLLEDPVDCRKECACADEIDIRSRNIGRYEIAKDFLHWMKDLQLNRVLSDD